MIQIFDKKDCCGCFACVQRCPKQCISMKEDETGFSYPQIDASQCIDCGLCEKVCPVLNQNTKNNLLSVYAVKNKNEAIRFKSSSGGFFSILAEYIISNGGVVFGALFNESYEVVHSYTEDFHEIDKFRASKYVQSKIGDSYKKVEYFLRNGRLVLFSGTSCQIKALSLFLRKHYSNLFTVEIVCHGVPSPRIWRDYLRMISKTRKVKINDSDESNYENSISHISFRNKSKGWKYYSFSIDAYSNRTGTTHNILNEYVQNNIYMKAFLNNLSIRPSCFECPSKKGKSLSDFAIADFWSVDSYYKKFNDDKGITLVYVHTEQAKSLISRLCNIDLIELNMNNEYNKAYSLSTSVRYPLDDFWRQYNKIGLDCILPICKKNEPSLMSKIINQVKFFIKGKK